ncbi:unnamed protein product [Larinioides sclopetarius]|uniref:Uncharacterized protein n=1 Tax=Larinioides sclopetarius TaxID=280406 RepID=A0AAV1ZNG4_9ARAC
MERGQSPKIEDSNYEYHAAKPNYENRNNTKTLTDREENLEPNKNSFPDSSKHDQNENLSQYSLQSSSEKFQIKGKVDTLEKSIPNVFDETSLESKISSLQKFNSIFDDKAASKPKDISSRISSSVTCNESTTESKASFIQISEPFISAVCSFVHKTNLISLSNQRTSDVTGLEGEVSSAQKFITVSDEIASEIKDNTPEISSLILPYESVSDGKSRLTQISTLEDFDETGLLMKFGSLKISKPSEPKQNAFEKDTVLPLRSNPMIPCERTPEISDLPTGNLFNKIVSRSSEGLSFERSELFKLPEKSSKNRREKKNAMRKRRYHLSPKCTQNKAYDFQTFPLTLTGNSLFEWKFSSLEISDSRVNEKTPTDTIHSFGHISRPKDHDVTTSERNHNSKNQSKLDVSDETSLENQFSSFHISTYGNSNEHVLDNFNCPRISRLIASDEGDLLNSALPLKSDACIDFILVKDPFRDSESLLKSPVASITKSTRKWKKALKKRKTPRSHPEVNDKKGNVYPDVSLAKTLEIQIESKDESSQIPFNLVANETTSENVYFIPGINRFKEFDEHTLRSLHTLSCDCLCWLPDISENFPRYVDTIDLNKAAGNLKESKPPPKTNLGDHQDDLNRPSTSKIFTSVKSNKREQLLQEKANPNIRRNSKMKVDISHAHDSAVELNVNLSNLRRNSSLNQSRHLPSVGGNVKDSLTSSDPHRINYIELNDIYFPIPVSRNPLQTQSSKKDSQNGYTENTRKVIRNRSRTDSSNTVNNETQSNRYLLDSGKTDDSETNRNQSQSDSSKADDSETNRINFQSDSSNADDDVTNRNQSQSDSSKADNEASRNQS